MYTLISFIVVRISIKILNQIFYSVFAAFL
nr:MAG TPA: hypothetical protein [Caudoviricetes sp.]